MASMRIQSARRGYVILTCLLLAVVAAPLLIPATPNTVFARNYGQKKNYGARYAKYIAQCKGACGRKNGAIAACIRAERRTQANNCRQIYKADRGLCTDGTCAKEVKGRLKMCIRDAGGQAKRDARAIRGKRYGLKKCAGCCQRTKGEGDCLSYFSASRFFGAARYHGRLSCDGAGSASGDCVKQCQLQAARGRAACGRGGKGGPPDCLQQVEQALQACVAACPTSGSPSAALLGDRSGRIRAHVARWLPWLVQSWSG
jgi:hypothetical protein